MEIQWIGGGFRRISQSRSDIFSKIGVLVHLNRGTALEGHLGESVPSQRTMIFRRIYLYCNSPHDDDFNPFFFAHLSFISVSGKQVGILSDGDTRGQLESWRIFLAIG